MQIEKKHIKTGVYVLIGILLIVVLVYAIKAIRSFFGYSKPTVKVQWNATPYIPNGGNLAGFDPEPYIAEIHDVLQGWLIDASVRCSAYKRLMALQDNKFIAVVNTYYQTFGTTLRQDMNDTWQSGCTIFGKQWDEKIYDRMSDLNIIS